MIRSATHLNLIPAIRNEYGITAHGNTFGIDYGRVCGLVIPTEAEVTAVKAVGDVTGAVIMRGTQRIGYANRIRGFIHYQGTDGMRMVVASTDSGFTALTRKLNG